MSRFNLSVPELYAIANDLRKDVIRMLAEAGSGHSAGSLGMADVLSTLFFGVLNYDPSNPLWEHRDRLVLSNGHICPVLYAVMARAGFFPAEELMTLRKLGSRLQGHPSRLDLPGLEASTASLGQGLSISVGMALAAKLDEAEHRIYCIMSDGELEEGSSWEAANAANKYHLDNLCAIIDRNNIQIDGYTEEVWPLEPLDRKFEAYNWHVLKVNGHDIPGLLDALEKARGVKGRPSVIIALTIPGKGVSFMENRYEWHGIAPTRQQAEQALRELEQNFSGEGD